jgi:hypothetical protein
MIHTAPRTYEVAVVEESTPQRQAYHLLHIAFVVAPVVAGLDKFFSVLTNWDTYLAPRIAERLPLAAHRFMQVVGLVEIVAGIIVLLKPKIGGWIVGFWLLGIIANLLIAGTAYDVALRDLGLALGAFALARLAVVHEHSQRAAVRELRST